MNHPKRLRKTRHERSGGDGSRDLPELKLAEYSAPFGEELPWSIATEPVIAPADRCHLKPERGSLH